jgi:hypothetical protein
LPTVALGEKSGVEAARLGRSGAEHKFERGRSGDAGIGERLQAGEARRRTPFPAEQQSVSSMVSRIPVSAKARAREQVGRRALHQAGAAASSGAATGMRVGGTTRPPGTKRLGKKTAFMTAAQEYARLGAGAVHQHQRRRIPRTSSATCAISVSVLDSLDR